MITHLSDINLGDVRAIQGATLKLGYDFATHERPLGKATKQRLGGTLDEWRLSFKLSHHFCEPQDILNKIKKLCASGEPAPLVFDYIDYQGWVTLDSVDVAYQDIAPNGKPLTITGSLTLTEFVGNTQPLPTAPAVREQGQSIVNPSPVQTAITDDVNTLLPHRQPMQHLQQALIAQHKVQRLVRDIKDIKDGDTEALASVINDAVNTVNDYFDSDDWSGPHVLTLPDFSVKNPKPLAQHLNATNPFFTKLARSTVTRWLA